VKSLDTFDFTAIPGLNKMLVLELARCEFILRRENIIALGNSDPTSYCPPCYVIERQWLLGPDLMVAGVSHA
jgi:hypothetical protein